MSGRVYIEISHPTSGMVLKDRERIEDLATDVEWMYDDATQTLETHGWQKCYGAEEALNILLDDGFEVYISYE